MQDSCGTPLAWVRCLGGVEAGTHDGLQRILDQSPAEQDLKSLAESRIGRGRGIFNSIYAGPKAPMTSVQTALLRRFVLNERFGP
jgi:hypothetical protein